MLTCKKLSIQILKVSLILKLIIQITLTLIRGIVLDSVISTHLISQLTPVANKSISNYLLMKETEILHQILDHSKFISRFLERSSAHWVKCTYTNHKGSRFVIKPFLVRYRWSQAIFISDSNMTFPLTFFLCGYY